MFKVGRGVMMDIAYALRPYIRLEEFAGRESTLL